MLLPSYSTTPIMARTKIYHKHSRASLPHHRSNTNGKLLDSTRKTIREAWAESTTNQHRSGLRHYLRYMKSQAVPQQDWFPASEIILCNFANTFKGRLAGSSIRALLYGVRAFHIVFDYPYLTGNLLHYTLKGLDKATPESSKREKRRPVTKEMMDVLNEALDPSDRKDNAIGFHADAGFLGQIRLGEILPTNSNPDTFKSDCFPVGEDIHPAHSTHGSFSFHLPKTKTEQVHGEDVSLCKQGGKTDAVNSKNLHVHTNKIDKTTPVASYLLPNGERKILTKKEFLKRCNEIWVKKGYKKVTGHSFRIGGTTYYLLANVDPEVVKTMGRWSSDAFKRYWRDLEKLGVLHVELLDAKKERSRKNRSVKIVA